MKSKKIEESHLKYIQEKFFLDVEKLCKEKNNMSPMLDAIKNSCKYLLENIEREGLYEYAQKAIFGKDIHFPEEVTIASNIYEEVHYIGSTESIF